MVHSRCEGLIRLAACSSTSGIVRSPQFPRGHAAPSRTRPGNSNRHRGLRDSVGTVNPHRGSSQFASGSVNAPLDQYGRAPRVHDAANSKAISCRWVSSSCLSDVRPQGRALARRKIAAGHRYSSRERRARQQTSRSGAWQGVQPPNPITRSPSPQLHLERLELDMTSRDLGMSKAAGLVNTEGPRIDGNGNRPAVAEDGREGSHMREGGANRGGCVTQWERARGSRALRSADTPTVEACLSDPP